jgi:hypothetical protein
MSPAIPGKVSSTVKFKYFLLILAGFLAIFPAVRELYSCSVPVFRYALERWRPDPYKGIYIHKGEIAPKDQALLDQLNEAAGNADSPLNLIIREVNVDTFSKQKLEEVLQGPVPEELPVLKIWYPNQMGKSAPVWSEKLTPSLAQGLMQSPKRKQLAERLIRGDSVIFVFVPSGNKKKDEQAMSLIRQELDKSLTNFKKTPFSVLSGGARKLLAYEFPILTLSRDDPGERIFLDMLLKSESDLHEYSDEPMVFPVFGRGRLLGCLFGEYITERHLQEVTMFLAGACSCEVKDMNPGTDLLVAAPWDLVVMDAFVDDTPMPELTGVLPANTTAAEAEEPAEVDAAEAAVAEEPDPQAPALVKTALAASVAAPASDLRVPAPAAEKKADKSVLKVYGITLSSALVVVVFAGLVLNYRRRKKL